MADTVYFRLTVLTGILSDPLIGAFAAYRNGKTAAQKSAFLHELFERKAETQFAAYVADAVIKDDNAFSRACSAGDDLSDYLKKAYIADLAEIGRALDFETDDFHVGKPPALLKSWDDKAANLLNGYYQSSGYGLFLSCHEFRYERAAGLVPVRHPLVYSLSDLKNCERQKEEVYDNLENFVKGLSCANMLLYGETGSGKSSLLRATANAFASQKLRVVTLAREQTDLLPRVFDELAALPLRFLIVVEALNEELLIPEYESGNVMIAATSKVPREGFGVSIFFPPTDLEGFLAIVHELLKDGKAKIAPEDADALGRQWAEKHGTTPRSARQFAGFLLATQKKGKELKI